MKIKKIDLDNEIRGKIRDAIRYALLREFKTLPISPKQVDMFEKVLNEPLVRELYTIIIKYYKDIIEREVVCEFDTQDFIDIYFGYA